MQGKSRIPFAAALAALAFAIPAAAQRVPIDTTPSPDELRNIFTFQVENDVFNRIGKSDRDYTNGVRLGWLSPALPDLPAGFANIITFPTFFGEDPVSSVTRRVGISIGQNLTRRRYRYLGADPQRSALCRLARRQLRLHRSTSGRSKTGVDVRLDTVRLSLLASWRRRRRPCRTPTLIGVPPRTLGQQLTTSHVRPDLCAGAPTRRGPETPLEYDIAAHNARHRTYASAAAR